MSKRIEGQEMEAFSSLGHLALQQADNPFNMSIDPCVISLSGRFLDQPPLENQSRCQPSSSIMHSSKQFSVSIGKQAADHHSQLQANNLGSHAAAASSSQQATFENGDPIHDCEHTTLAPPDRHPLNEYNPKSDSSTRAALNPLTVVTGIFTCWSKNREKSGSFQHPRQPLHKLSAPILLEQTRLQQEALAETQDTRDMWEWQMEQQQAITSQEHTLLERNSVENPLKVLPELMGRNGSVNRSNSSTTSLLVGQIALTDGISGNFEQGKDFFDGGGDEGNDDQKVVPEQVRGDAKYSSNGGGRRITSGSESPSWDVHNHLSSNIWNDADLVSAMMLLFESALLRCRSEVAYFCRVYMQQMVLSGYALIRTLMEMEPNSVFARKVHASYALEAHVHAVMFRCFESDSFDKNGVTRILDPGARATAHAEEYVRMKGVDAEEALRTGSDAYEEAFHAYCAAKSEEVMSMFSWMSMGYRSAAERDRFMEAFLRAAKWVWLLHRLANSTHPPMHIFRIGRGHVIDPAYVESVSVPSIGTCPKCPPASPPKVEFMIMPGFISPSRKIFRCKAYQHYMCKQN